MWVEHHDIFTKAKKPKCLSTQHKGLTCQDHASMNAWVLNNPLAQLCCNELKVINRVKSHIELEWDLLEFIVLLTPKLLKCMLVKLTFYALFIHLGITTWGVGSIPPNVISKVEWNKDLALIIWRNQSTDTKVLKGAWDIKNWKKAFSKILWHQEIYVFTQYYDSPRDLLVYTIPCIIDDSWPINKFLHIQNQRYWNTWYIVLIRVFAFIIRFETTLKKSFVVEVVQGVLANC